MQQNSLQVVSLVRGVSTSMCLQASCIERAFLALLHGLCTNGRFPKQSSLYCGFPGSVWMEFSHLVWCASVIGHGSWLRECAAEASYLVYIPLLQLLPKRPGHLHAQSRGQISNVLLCLLLALNVPPIAREPQCANPSETSLEAA